MNGTCRGIFAVMSAALALGYSGVASSTVWQTGDEITYSQAEWGGTGAAATLLTGDYNTVYSSTGGAFVIGDSSAFTEQFDSGDAVHLYLPQSGTPGALTATLFDPTSSPSGAFGGDVAALKLNIDFGDAGLLAASAVPFGDLVLTGFAALPNLNGLTTRQFLAAANTCLGGGACIDSITDLDSVTSGLAGSFANSSVPNDFAQLHLAAPTVVTVPEPSTALLIALAIGGLGFVVKQTKPS